ncbi:hypothetical protein HELRODRAFT_183247 [Helobdella robusta]|uniref:Uncharacterized protein n=1 Tax=Helobdella robusta TaxID=6412 RepID=T1FJD2_HELRO|nr:hypothetical protein HELRODRAFT_183247 [Helobdella robusta]ESO11367.1 hypothetical protein HELRODRAFT_183247 [Helobdella robusta]
MGLQDDEGTYLISELIEQTGEHENSEEVEDEGVEEIEQESVAESNKELDMALICDKIKLASARMIVDAIYKEAATTVQVALTKGKSPWLDKVRTTLDLNSVLDVQGWLEKLTDCVRNLENPLPPQTLKWNRFVDSTLNDARQVRLATFEIWSEINATLTDNLQVNEGLLDELVRHHIINEHIKSRLSTLPNRKAKVKYLLNYLLDMGSSVMFTFGNILTSIGQKSLGRIVIKRLNDNKIPTNLL